MRKFRNRTDITGAYTEIHIEGNVATWFTAAGKKTVDHITQRPVSAYIERLLADGFVEERPCGKMRASAYCSSECELLDRAHLEKTGHSRCRIPSEEKHVNWHRKQAVS